jgi:hypothetical protein
MPDYQQRFVTVGRVRMTMQAFIVLMVGVALTVGATIVALVARSPVFLFLALLLLGVFFYAAYAINCMVVGQCVALSWILVASYLIYLFFIIARLVALGSVLAMLKK